MYTCIVSDGYWTTDDRICTSECYSIHLCIVVMWECIFIFVSLLYVCMHTYVCTNVRKYVHMQESGHNRPMTSVKGAGYTSAGRSEL